MKTQKLRFLFTIILLVAYIAPSVEATSLTVYVQDSFDDAFILQNGNYFGDTPFLPLRSEGTNNILGTRFRNVNVPQGAKINNATLQVRTSWGYASAGDIRVTIAGDDIDDSSPFNDSSSFLRTYTHAFKVWNISEVNGAGWNYVDVTEIVQEIVDRVGWVSGNSLSLVYFTDAGTPRREFATIDNNAGYRPRINIFHSVEPTPDEVDDIADQAPGPFNDTDVYDWTKNDTYRGIDIWVVTEPGDPELLVFDGNTLTYMNSTKGTAVSLDWAGASTFDFATGGACEILARQDPYLFVMGQNGSALYIYWSDDEFQTWKTYRINEQYPDLTGHGSNFGSMWTDQNGSDVIHFVWSSRSDWNNAVYDILYTNFTIDSTTGNLTWAANYFNVTVDQPTNQNEPDMYQEKDGTIHIAWYGRNGTVEDQIQYRRRQANGTWLPQVRVSGLDAFDSTEPDIVANELTGVALISWWYVDVGNSVAWDVVFPNNTVGTIIGNADRQFNNRRYPSMVNDRSTNVAHMTYQDSSGNLIEYRFKLIDNSTAWSGESHVSPAAQQHTSPVIGLDEKNDTLAIIWYNQWNTQVAYEVFQVGDSPVQGKPTFNVLNSKYPRSLDYFDRVVLNTFIFLSYPNGTLIGEVPEGTDPKDVIDDLLGGAQPEDPQTEEYGPLNKFSWKLLVLVTGMIMLVGSPIAGVAFGADTGTWIKLLYVMFFGIGLLWAIKSM